MALKTILTVFIMLISLACSKDDVWKTTEPEASVRSPDEIYQKLAVQFDEEHDQLSYFVQFRDKQAYGASLELRKGSSVTADGTGLEFRRANPKGGELGGSTYNRFVDHPNSLLKPFEFNWVSMDGRKFTNSITLPGKFRVLPKYSSVKRQDKELVLEYIGPQLLDTDSFSMSIQGDFGHYVGIEGKLTPENTIVIDLKNYVDPKGTGEGQIQIYATVSREGKLQGATRSGGRIWSSYSIAPVKVTIRP